MSEKFAVYVVMVEDTEKADLELSAQVLDMARIGGNMTYAAASDLVMDTPVENYDKAE